MDYPVELALVSLGFISGLIIGNLWTYRPRVLMAHEISELKSYITEQDKCMQAMEEHTKWFCNKFVNNSDMKRRCHSESDLQKRHNLLT